MFLARNPASRGEFWFTDGQNPPRKLTDNDAVLFWIAQYHRAGRPLINLADGQPVVPGQDWIAPMPSAQQLRFAVGAA